MINVDNHAFKDKVGCGEGGGGGGGGVVQVNICNVSPQKYTYIVDTH